MVVWRSSLKATRTKQGWDFVSKGNRKATGRPDKKNDPNVDMFNPNYPLFLLFVRFGQIIIRNITRSATTIPAPLYIFKAFLAYASVSIFVYSVIWGVSYKGTV